MVIEHVRPTVDGGEFPAKATRGLPASGVGARVRGRARSAARLGLALAGRPPLRARRATPRGWSRCRWSRAPGLVTAPGSSRAGIGAWSFAVVGILDTWGGWARDLTIRFEAGVDVELDLADGAALAAARTRAAGDLQVRPRGPSAPSTASSAAAPTRRGEGRVRHPRRHDRADAAHRRSQPRHDRRTLSDLWVEREVAGYSAWYEMFPRSEGAVPPRSGTLQASPSDACPRSRRWASPSSTCRRSIPSAPRTARGRTTSPSARRADPGSPWAIGAAAGGHTAVHPDLGTIDDFDALRRRGAARGPRGRARLRPPVQPRSPLGHRAPASGSGTARTARSATRRIRPSSTRTSTRSTSTASDAAGALDRAS